MAGAQRVALLLEIAPEAGSIKSETVPFIKECPETLRISNLSDGWFHHLKWSAWCLQWCPAHCNKGSTNEYGLHGRKRHNVAQDWTIELHKNPERASKIIHFQSTLLGSHLLYKTKELELKDQQLPAGSDVWVEAQEKKIGYLLWSPLRCGLHFQL